MTLLALQKLENAELWRCKMAKQNIYDNEIFFEGYKKIRDNEINANNLFEIPYVVLKGIWIRISAYKKKKGDAGASPFWNY